MRCDYYKHKVLIVNLKNDPMPVEIILSTENGYYIDHNFDSDEENYDEKCKMFYLDQLRSNFEPIYIYRNGKFENDRLEKKYKTEIIRYFFDHDYYGIQLGNDWENVIDMYKTEIRIGRN